MGPTTPEARWPSVYTAIYNFCRDRTVSHMSARPFLVRRTILLGSPPVWTVPRQPCGFDARRQAQIVALSSYALAHESQEAETTFTLESARLRPFGDTRVGITRDDVTGVRRRRTCIPAARKCVCADGGVNFASSFPSRKDLSFGLGCLSFDGHRSFVHQRR